MIGNFFDQLIDIALNFLASINFFSERIIWFIFSPISELYEVLALVGGDVAAGILNSIGIGQYSIFTLMLTGGIVIYMGYQFIVWLVNLIT